MVEKLVWPKRLTLNFNEKFRWNNVTIIQTIFNTHTVYNAVMEIQKRNFSVYY